MGSPCGDGQDGPVNGHGDHDRCLDVSVGNGGVGVRLGGSEDEVETGRHEYGEDGAAGVGGGMNVAAIAGSGDSRLPASQKEPGVSKKRNPVMGSIARRTPPKM